MLLKCISLPSFPIGRLALTACCYYVLPLVEQGPREPKHVACGYFVRSCRCVGRMYIFYGV